MDLSGTRRISGAIPPAAGVSFLRPAAERVDMPRKMAGNLRRSERQHIPDPVMLSPAWLSMDRPVPQPEYLKR